MDFLDNEDIKEFNKMLRDIGGMQLFREDFDFKNRRLAYDEIEGYLVSTIDIGLDMSFIGYGFYWETAVFKDGELISMQRFDSKEKALEWHKHLMANVDKLDNADAMYENYIE